MSYREKPYIEKCRKVSLEKATTPISGFVEIVKDSYWLTTPNGEILYYCMQEGDMTKGKGSRQCNARKEVAEGLRDKLYPEGIVKQIPFVYNKHDCRDYY